MDIPGNLLRDFIMLKLNSLPIVVKLGMLFLALAAVLAGGIGISSYRISSSAINKTQHGAVERFSGNIRNNIQAFMDSRREAIANTLKGGGIDKFLAGGDKEALRAYLERNSQGLLSLSYYSPAGKLQATTAKKGQCREHRTMPAPAGPGKSSGYSSRVRYCEMLKAFVLELSYTCLDHYDKPRGSLLTYVELTSLRKELDSLTIGRNGFFIVTTQEGAILYAPDRKRTGHNIIVDDTDPEMTRLIQSGEGTATAELGGKAFHLDVKTVPKYGWLVLTAIPEIEFTAPLAQVKKDILLFSLIIVALGVFAGLIGSHVLITRPISALTKAVLDISENRNFEARVPALHDDEIGSVARAFNSVLAELSGFHSSRLTKSEEKLSAAEAQLRQAQKMEIVGRLAGGVAHDFNNLLTTILANCTFLLNELPEGDPRRDDVLGIRGAGERAATLTRQLLAFSRKQILQPKLIDLNASIADTQKIIKRLIGEDIEIKTTLAAGLPTVKADPGQIEQIIMNLAVNARDAMPGGGLLHFTTAALYLPPGTRLEHTSVGLPPGKYVTLTVADNGMGMSKNTLSHLFEPFFTTKEEGKGTGLGLAMVYGIIKQSAGFIDVKSAFGKGAVFTIYLPAQAGQAHAETKRAALPDSSLKHAGTILVVEDDEDLLKMTSRILRGAGYAVIEAATARAALGLLDKDFKLLFTDVTLPDISGVDLAAQILKVKPGIPVIYTSGYSDNEDLRGLLSKAEHCFIQKPFTNEGLLRKIAEVLVDFPSGEKAG